MRRRFIRMGRRSRSETSEPKYGFRCQGSVLHGSRNSIYEAGKPLMRESIVIRPSIANASRLRLKCA